MKLYKFNLTQNISPLINYKNQSIKNGDKEHERKATKLIIKIEDGRILGTPYSLVDGETWGVAMAYVKRGLGL